MGKLQVDVLAHQAPDSFISEQYRTVRTNIEVLKKNNKLKSLFLSSANSGEGKTTTVLNLAVIFAKANINVLLVDCDLRKHSLTDRFYLTNANGFVSLFDGKLKSLLEEVYPTNVENLHFLPSGSVAINPAEILLNDHFKLIHEELKSKFDLVLFDTPPIEEVADALILAQELDGCVLVVREKYSKKDAVKRAKEALDEVGANLLGIINNDVELPNTRGYGYAYGYGEKKEKGGLFGIFKKS